LNDSEVSEVDSFYLSMLKNNKRVNILSFCKARLGRK